MRRGSLFAAAALAAAGCACPPAAPSAALAPASIAAVRIAAAPPALEANLRVEAYEVVEDSCAESFASTTVLIDGAVAGRTTPGLKSARKRWEGRTTPGNHLMRFERWLLPRVARWKRAAADRQPRERFVRVEDGMRTDVIIKYYQQGRKYSYHITRSPLKQ